MYSVLNLKHVKTNIMTLSKVYGERGAYGFAELDFEITSHNCEKTRHSILMIPLSKVKHLKRLK
jgi:hypothetical protein